MAGLDDYTEPKLILLRDLLPGGELYSVMPAGTRDLAVSVYRRARDNVSANIGELELAWSRGHQSGQHAAITTLREMGHLHVAAELMKRYGMDNEGSISATPVTRQCGEQP